MEFWRNRIPSLTVVGYTILAWVIPWLIYRLNRAWHRYGDPPWKNESSGGGEASRGPERTRREEAPEPASAGSFRNCSADCGTNKETT